MTKAVTKRYSEAFKRQVVREYEAGERGEELRQKYGIGGRNTLTRWLKQYGTAATRQELIVIQRPQERAQAQQMARRVQELETALAEVTLEKLVLRATLAEAEQRLGEPVEKKVAR